MFCLLFSKGEDEMIVFSISLIVSLIFGWSVSKFLVNAMTGCFGFFISLLVINNLAAYIAYSLGIFDITGIIIGVVIGSLYGVLTETLRFD